MEFVILIFDVDMILYPNAIITVTTNDGMFTAQSDITIVESISDVSIINTYPNPTFEFINIETSANKKIISMYVYDSIGRVVMEVPQNIFDSNAQYHQVNVSHLAKGVYSLIITTDDFKPHIEKIVVR